MRFMSTEGQNMYNTLEKYFLSELGIELQVLCMLSNRSTVELHLQSSKNTLIFSGEFVHRKYI